MMNCVFLAESKGIAMDALCLTSRDSLVLQQAVEITKGILIRVIRAIHC